MKAETRGVEGIVIRSSSPSRYVSNLTRCVAKQAGITIAVGGAMANAVDAVASSYPTRKFAIVDVDVSTLEHRPKNVEGLLFRAEQAGYLVGYAAGLWAKTHPIRGKQVVGSVGGIKIPPVDRYIAGYEYGAKAADPQITTLKNYSQSFSSPAMCHKAALGQIARGSSVEFEVAGACGRGVLDAAQEQGVFAIATDADDGGVGPWVMTSALKRVDVAVFSAIEAARDGRLQTGSDVTIGAGQNGVAYGRWSSLVPPRIRFAVARQFALMRGGKLGKIPTSSN